MCVGKDWEREETEGKEGAPQEGNPQVPILLELMAFSEWTSKMGKAPRELHHAIQSIVKGIPNSARILRGPYNKIWQVL